MSGCSGAALPWGPVAVVLQPPCAGLHLPAPSYPVPSRPPCPISWGLLEGWFGCSLCWKDTLLGKHPGIVIFKPGCPCPGCPLGGGGMVCTWPWKEHMGNPAK